jgi:hypothetical protein
VKVPRTESSDTDRHDTTRQDEANHSLMGGFLRACLIKGKRVPHRRVGCAITPFCILFYRLMTSFEQTFFQFLHRLKPRRTISRDSSVGRAIELWAGQPKNHASFPGRCKRFEFPRKVPISRGSLPPSLPVNCTAGCFSGDEAVRA